MHDARHQGPHTTAMFLITRQQQLMFVNGGGGAHCNAQCDRDTIQSDKEPAKAKSASQYKSTGTTD